MTVPSTANAVLITLARATLALLLCGGSGCSAPTTDRAPFLLDSEVEPSSDSDEVERLRAMRAIRMQARPTGCVSGERLLDHQTFDPLKNYYFSEKEAGSDCPVGCTPDATSGKCVSATVTACSAFDDGNDPAECFEQRWLPIATDPNPGQTDAAVYSLLEAVCADRGLGLDCASSGDPGDGCSVAVCNSLTALCMANSALELSAVRAAPLVFELTSDAGTVEVSIPSQSTATNSGLAEFAMTQARIATSTALNGLHSGLGISSSGASLQCSTTSLDTAFGPGAPDGVANHTPAQLLTRTMADAYGTYREALDAFVEQTTAVADSQRGTANAATGVHRQMAGPMLSRAAAAHAIYGGDSGFQGGPLPDGLAAVPELSGAGREALSLFRLAALCPADVLAIDGTGVIPTDKLVYSTTTFDPDLPPDQGSNLGTPTQGSVVQRLLQRGYLTDEDLETAPERGLFFAQRSLTVDHFHEARHYLIAEYLVHRRDLTRASTETVPGDYTRFAATEYAPTGGARWQEAAWLRSSSPQLGYTQTTTTDPTAGPSVINLQYVGNATDFTYQSAVLAAESLQSPLLNSLSDKDELIGNLGFWIQQMIEDVPGVFIVCKTDEATIRVSYYGSGAATEPVASVGEAWASCIIDGKAESVACPKDETEPMFETGRMPRILSAGQAGEIAAYLEQFETDLPSSSAGTNVILAAPDTPTSAGNAGDFEFLAAAPIPSEIGECNVTPAAPGFAEEAGSLVGASPDSPAHTELECDGSMRDQKLPLEDELSSDGDGVESSWKHYLALARQAADEADLLAQEYIQAGLDLDQREESIELREQSNEIAAVHELERLQQICGVNLDPSILLENLKKDSDGNDFTEFAVDPTCGPDCACTSNLGCPQTGQDKSTCHAGRCLKVLDASAIHALGEDPDLRRLSRCLSESETIRAITPGDTHLCYWEDPFDPNLICEDPAYLACLEQERTSGVEANCPRRPCPYTVEEDTEECAGTGPAGQQPKQTLATLDYFHTGHIDNGGDGGIDNVATEACEIIREMRTLDDQGELEQRVDKLKGLNLGRNSIFSWPVVAQTVGNMEFRTAVGTHMSLTLSGGTKWKTTGSAIPEVVGWGDLNIWPCHDEYGCEGDSLFCKQTCGPPVQNIVPTISRIQRAFVALNHLGNDTLSEKCTLEAIPDSGDWSISEGRQRYACTSTHPNAIEPVRLTNRSGIQETGHLIPYYDGKLEIGKHNSHSDRDVYLHTVPNQTTWTWFNVGESEGTMFAPVTRTWYTESFVAASDPRDDVSLRTAAPQHSMREYWKGLSNLDSDYNGVVYHVLTQPSSPGFQGIDRNTMFDAVELYCRAYEAGGSTLRAGAECNSPNWDLTKLKDVDEVEDMAKTLSCMAREIESSGGKALLFNFPEQAVDALRTVSSVGVFPALGGDMAQQIASIRENLIELHSAGPLIASHVRQLALDLEAFRLRLQDLQLTAAINDKLSEREMLAQAGRCAESLASGVGSGASSFGGGLLVTATVCVNASLQMDLISQIQTLQDEKKQGDIDAAAIDFRQRFEDRSSSLERIAVDIANAQERLDQALASLENLRLQANRALSNATWLSSLQASQQFNINSAMRRRFNTARIRYEQAHDYAKSMSILARRSIEARLGLHLDQLPDPLPLVDAPKNWVHNVCATSAIDYDAIREVLDDPQSELSNYADGFIGRYVRNLEAVVESYRLSNNFHEGEDIAIVSLRDDVLGVRAPCQAPSINLIRDAGQLHRGVAWGASGCAVDASDEPLPSCVLLSDWLDGPSGVGDDANEGFVPSLVTFGFSPTNGDVTPCGGACGLTEDTAWEQSQELSPGRYLLSWHAKKVVTDGSATGTNPSGEDSVRLLCPNVTSDSPTAEPPVDLGDGWYRYTREIVLPNNTGVQSCTAAIVPVGASPESQQVVIGGIMLERNAIALGPSRFEATDSLGMITEYRCEDTEGTFFRALWSDGSSTLCDNGFSGDCAPSLLKSRGYKQVNLPISQERIERGDIFGRAGFAEGNFNYRIADIALNFVGTDVRTCESTDLPQTCYSAGYVPYSVVHIGPYYVRNHDGGAYEAPLFTGNIEHARGLATERYITNPLSDSDKGLLADYFRKEFQGRPLDGNFTIRVWDDEGFDFSQIQDVQLILKYRYWTRFD